MGTTAVMKIGKHYYITWLDGSPGSLIPDVKKVFREEKRPNESSFIEGLQEYRSDVEPISNKKIIGSAAYFYKIDLKNRSVREAKNPWKAYSKAIYAGKRAKKKAAPVIKKGAKTTAKYTKKGIRTTAKYTKKTIDAYRAPRNVRFKFYTKNGKRKKYAVWKDANGRTHRMLVANFRKRYGKR